MLNRCDPLAGEHDLLVAECCIWVKSLENNLNRPMGFNEILSYLQYSRVYVIRTEEE